MRNVAIIGAGMTRFGKFLDRSMKDLGREAVEEAEKSAGISRKDIEAAVVGNSMAGIVTGQETIRGQVILREMGFGDIPIVNTENACASSATAFHIGWLYVASGMYDCVLALGVEKLYHEDKKVSFAAIGSAVDVEAMREAAKKAKEEADLSSAEARQVSEGAGEKRSMFMDFYAAGARSHMQKYGTTKEQFAKIAVKNHLHGSMNPHAQYQNTCTVEDVLLSPLVVEPLTRLMCSPIGDGAAAAIICSEEKARQFTANPIWVKASVLTSGMDLEPGDEVASTRAAHRAYELAGVGPKDINIFEVHDASAPAELMIYEELGLCGEGEGGQLIDSGDTQVGGRWPVNTSGGLLAKGHPVGATGVAQVAEVYWQLKGEAGDRQVKDAKVGMTENGGGAIRGEPAAMTVHILST